MDQLKIVLEHRFWILSALAILIPPISWYMSTGDMAKKTDDRAKAIKASIKKNEDLAKGVAKDANPEWIEGVKEVNAKLAVKVSETHKRLYEHQVPVMTWNPTVRKALDRAKVKYRSDNAGDPQAFLTAKKLYIARYPDMWKEIFEIVEPFSLVTQKGKVWCHGKDASSDADITRAPFESWTQRQIISSEEMWDAQEDLWMLKALLKAVARVNEGSISIDDARIKKLSVAMLRGGDLGDLNSRRNPKAAGGGPGGKIAPSLISAAAMGGGGAPRDTPMIDPDDIFGSSDAGGGGGAAAGPGMRGGGRASAAPGEGRRYVSASGGKWRTRGFVLRVVMDHQEIPRLLSMLTDSPFPVQILQVEHDVNNSKNSRVQTFNLGEFEGDQKRGKEIQQRLQMALSQPYLADVQVAGTYTFYDEPASATPTPAAAATSAPAKTTPGTKAPAAGSASGKAGSTKAAPSTTAAPTKAVPGKGPGPAGSSSAPGAKPAVTPTPSGTRSGAPKSAPSVKS